MHELSELVMLRLWQMETLTRRQKREMDKQNEPKRHDSAVAAYAAACSVLVSVYLLSVSVLGSPFVC